MEICVAKGSVPSAFGSCQQSWEKAGKPARRMAASAVCRAPAAAGQVWTSGRSIPLYWDPWPAKRNATCGRADRVCLKKIPCCCSTSAAAGFPIWLAATFNFFSSQCGPSATIARRQGKCGSNRWPRAPFHSEFISRCASASLAAICSLETVAMRQIRESVPASPAAVTAGTGGGVTGAATGLLRVDEGVSSMSRGTFSLRSSTTW